MGRGGRVSAGDVAVDVVGAQEGMVRLPRRRECAFPSLHSGVNVNVSVSPLCCGTQVSNGPKEGESEGEAVSDPRATFRGASEGDTGAFPDLHITACVVAR